MLNEQVFKGNWTEIRGRVKEKWGSLTDDDLVLAEGNMDQLVGIVQRRTGESREKIEHELDQLTHDYGSQMDRIRQQAGTAAASASDTARQYADQASDLTRQQLEQFQQQYGQVAADLQAKYAEAEAAVRRSPIESICVAFGAGLVAGVIAGLLLRPSRD
jgi:uncharacterized protein YjbJ (UPF0337 family)